MGQARHFVERVQASLPVREFLRGRFKRASQNLLVTARAVVVEFGRLHARDVVAPVALVLRDQLLAVLDLRRIGHELGHPRRHRIFPGRRGRLSTGGLCRFRW